MVDQWCHSGGPVVAQLVTNAGPLMDYLAHSDGQMMPRLTGFSVLYWKGLLNTHKLDWQLKLILFRTLVCVFSGKIEEKSGN